jgi:hypothetical protein
MISMGLVLGASAQKVVRGGGGYHGHVNSPRPRVSVGVGLGYGFGYSPFYSPYYGFGSPYYNSPYGYGYNARPSRLDLKIEDIKLDYADQIRGARADESLTRKERRLEVQNLKLQRDKALVQAKKDYYYRRSAPQRPANNGNNNNSDNNNGGNSDSNDKGDQ